MFDINIKCIYNKSIQFEWDNSKREINLRKHKLDFDNVAEIFNGPRILKSDNRGNYGEKRYLAFGFIKSRLVVVAYTERSPDIIRVISLRKANRREQKKFEAKIKN